MGPPDSRLQRTPQGPRGVEWWGPRKKGNKKKNSARVERERTKVGEKKTRVILRE